jgi:hypothetical protein
MPAGEQAVTLVTWNLPIFVTRNGRHRARATLLRIHFAAQKLRLRRSEADEVVSAVLAPVLPGADLN